tara:strand:- start:539 stop:859 length:321 start_codon:yes stop_codon:yes gene_type:complete
MDTPTRQTVLQTAIDVTTGDRNDAYGDPVCMMSYIARLWQAYFNGLLDIQPSDVAHCMQLVKIARSDSENPYRQDNYVDNAAYAGIAAECRLHEERLQEEQGHDGN